VRGLDTAVSVDMTQTSATATVRPDRYFIVHINHLSRDGTHTIRYDIQMSAGVSVAGTVVHFVEEVKLLGVTLDPALTLINM